VQAETVDVGAQGLARCALARHRTPEHQHLLTCAGSEGDAVSDSGSPQRARFLTVGIGLGQVGLAHVVDQHAPAREHLHEPGDDGVQQCIELVVGRRTRLDETGHAIGVAAVHAVQHQAVKVNVEVGGGPEAQDQRDSATVAFVSGEPGSGPQVPRDHALHPLQHRYRGNQAAGRCPVIDHDGLAQPRTQRLRQHARSDVGRPTSRGRYGHRDALAGTCRSLSVRSA
jgi:hypothetical protein